MRMDALYTRKGMVTPLDEGMDQISHEGLKHILDMVIKEKIS